MARSIRGFLSDALIHGAVVVGRPVLSMLNEFLVLVDFKRTRPVFLLNDQHRVSSHHNHVDFPLARLAQRPVCEPIQTRASRWLSLRLD